MKIKIFLITLIMCISFNTLAKPENIALFGIENNTLSNIIVTVKCFDNSPQSNQQNFNIKAKSFIELPYTYDTCHGFIITDIMYNNKNYSKFYLDYSDKVAINRDDILNTLVVSKLRSASIITDYKE